MAAISSLVFITPWLLAALVVLPIIYWLLRATPPSPRRITFPAIRLLQDLHTQEETPDRTPWWLLLLRVVVAGLIIVALARPVLNPGDDIPGDGPVLIVADTGWSAAVDWEDRHELLLTLIARASRQDRLVGLLPTRGEADGSPVAPPQFVRPADARTIADNIEPGPWPGDREAAAAALENLEAPSSSVHTVWLTDGLDGPGTERLAEKLQDLGSVTAIVPDSASTARLVAPPEFETRQLRVPIHRSAPGSEETLEINLIAADGRILGRQPATFGVEDTRAAALFDLPADLRNEAVRAEIDGTFTAGAVALLDERWRRRPVGIVGASGDTAAQPLLDEQHYLRSALAPYSEIRTAPLVDLVDGGNAVIVLTDAGHLPDHERNAAEAYMEDGGILLRFAGPRLAAAEDPLVPVTLRSGDRTLSGALTWSDPMTLSAFSDESPFSGLEIPDDLLIERQVLAQPSGALSARTWARLRDGTPLVTADRRGDGWLVLIHTTATPEWSNLPLSGLFVEMLRRVIALSEGVATSTGTNGETTLNPLQTLNAFGQLGPAPATALPLRSEDLNDPVVDARHPPGFYGQPDARRAVSLGAAIAPPSPIALPSTGIATTGYAVPSETDLLPYLITLALILMIVDAFIALVLRGLIPLPALRYRSQTAISLVACVAATGLAAGIATSAARAADGGLDQPDERTLAAATNTYLAYVETGFPQVDNVSRAGLEALVRILGDRTSVEAAGAMGVDPAVDELAFFPLIYWPIPADHPDLSPAAVDSLNDYLRHGGMIVFDTRDSGPSTRGFGETPAGRRLQSLVVDLDIPALETVPDDHVLTRAFYLLQSFPGRYPNGEVWVETPAERVNDGVSGIVIGGSDWAAAWARDSQTGRPLFPVSGGHDVGPERQREMAYRFGVNLVLYALTGNYKADQVHVPAILERLTQ